ncbi:MAG: TlpA family protein disulfide reductase [Acidobacteria bacterium]|nr:TlpA family protein disulfide reductase [Acidobacteriota bacterium]
MKMFPVLLLTAIGLTAVPYCDAPKPVQAELRRAAAEWDRPQKKAEREANIRAILSALVEKYPDDIQANRRFQNDANLPKDEKIARYRKRLDEKPDDALSIYLYALTLGGRDAVEQKKLYEAALQKDPELAWVHMALAYDYAFGSTPDKKKTTGHVDAFFKLCPTSYDFYTNRMLGQYASPDVLQRVTAALRARVDADIDPDMFGIYEHLWMLEFKVMPPAQHDALRKKVAEDVARIRRMTPQMPLARLRMVRDGLKQANDTAGVNAAEDELIRSFPDSPDACRMVVERWRNQHPYPKPNEDAAKTKDFWQTLYGLSGEWIAKWPMEPQPRASRFSSARQLKDLPPAELKAAMDQLLNFLRGNEVMYGFTPYEHEAAEEYVARGIYIDEIPALAEAGLPAVRERTARQLGDGQLPAEIRKVARAPLQAAEIGAVDLLARAYLKQGASERAGALEKRLEPLVADNENEKAMKMRAASHVAELAGRKMDAFVYLEQSLEVGRKATNDIQKKKNSEVQAEMKRLWTAMGGTEKTWSIRTEKKPAVLEAKGSAGWAAPEKKLGTWELFDLAGKPWSSRELAGKTVFVNVWATWCGPCRVEHPEFQKLYERMKDRTDVAVISFNVDEQTGMVKNYMDEGKFTFPVLFADRLTRSMSDVISIPRNWLIDRQGVHQTEQVGFAASSDWVDRMVEAIEKTR